MKKTMLFAALLIAMSVTINAQSNMQNKNADQAVTTVLEQMTGAYNKSNVPFLKNILQIPTSSQTLAVLYTTRKI